MLVADATVVLWVVILFGIGLIGFVLMAVSLLWRVFADLGSAIRGLFSGGGGRGAARRIPPIPPAGEPQECPNERCRHPNTSEARFCARCGHALRRGRDVDAYG